MTREERAARIDELRRWIQEQDTEFRDEGFPADVQSAWDQNNAELREHESVTAELEARDARIAEVIKTDDGAERGSDSGSYGRQRQSVQMISRMSEADVYDMSSIRANPFNPGVSANEIRERALRANELSHYAQPHVDQDYARGHVEHLIRRAGGDDDAVARRVLVTGHPDYQRAFGKLVMANTRGQAGQAALTPAESRAVEATRAALAVGTPGQGGFAVPVTLDATVIPTSNYSVNPFRAVCRVEQISGYTWNGLTSAGATATYAAENAPATDANVAFLQPTLNMIRAQTFVPTSIELTQDWGGLQNAVALLISDAKDDLEASKFTTGVGTTEPLGLITGATTTTGVTGGAGTFTIPDLYALEGSVPPRFRPRSVVIGNRAIFNRIRQFDTSGGSGVWLAGSTANLGGLTVGLNNSPGGGIGQQIIGYPAYEDTAMASVITTGSKVLVMGDPRYYLIVDRIGMDIELIPHLFSTSTGFPLGQRGFYAFWRNNATVLSPNAFRVLLT